jgi:hypothetical protein
MADHTMRPLVSLLAYKHRMRDRFIRVVDFVIRDEPRGHAHFVHGTVTIFLAKQACELLSLPSEYFPFQGVECLIEELVVHELIHILTGEEMDHVVDSWHMLLCRMLSNRARCDCPIDCFWQSLAEPPTTETKRPLVTEAQ